MKRNRPMPKVKRVNQMREKLRNENEFDNYVNQRFKEAIAEERQAIQRFVDDEQIEKINYEYDL